jgi:hypothetical protein
MSLKPLTPLLLLTTLAVASFAAAGCSSDDSTNPRYANKNSNFLGLVTIKPDSFAYTNPTSLTVHSNQVYSAPNVSGTQVSLLCGLFTYDDY